MSVLVKCKQHPRYLARRAPRAKCDSCGLLWDLRQGIELRSGEDHTSVVIA